MRLDAISAAILVVLATSVAGFAPVGRGVQWWAPSPAASTCAVLQQHTCSVFARVAAGGRAAVSPAPAAYACTPRPCAPVMCAALPGPATASQGAVQVLFFEGATPRQTR